MTAEARFSGEELAGLVGRAKSRDPEAFESLVERYQYAVYGAAYAMLGNFDDAQDAAQEALILAWRDLPNLRDPLRFPAWLQQITRNRCLDLLRRNRMERRTISLSEVEDVLPASSASHPALDAEKQETAKTLQSVIADLSEPNRLATTLFYINGYSIEEVAGFLEVPEGTVKRRLHDSRKQLKARMMDMVADTMKSNPLPDDFTRKTVEKAVAEAREMMQRREFGEAERKLRDALKKIPDHPEALGELNKAMMGGGVLQRGRWNLLREIADQGKAIIASEGQADDATYANTAQTLLAIPAMPEAVGLIKEWMDQMGPNIQRLCMLAWAHGCMAHYDEAESLWNDVIALSAKATPEEMDRHFAQGCFALVDCYAAAGEKERAARVAISGREVCQKGDLFFPAFPVLTGYRRPSWFWPLILRKAVLAKESVEVAKLCIREVSHSFENDPYKEPRRELTVICLRAWFDSIESIISDFIDYAKRYPNVPGDLRLPLVLSLYQAERVEEIFEVSERTQGQDETGKRKAWPWWHYVPFHIARYLHESHNTELAEKLVREAQEAGVTEEGLLLGDIAIMRGEPTPQHIMKEIDEKGPDNAHYDAWYHIAREAAAAGDADRAFSALKNAVDMWSNPPLFLVNFWKSDTRWGNLRNDPRFEQILGEKRRKIGPIYGQLHYFPNW